MGSEDGQQPITSYRLVCFAPSLYSLSAVKQAAYKMSSQIRVVIEPSENGIECQIRPIKACAEQELSVLEDAFRLEVLDYDLREKIATETEPLRNLILSVAFSKINK